MITLTINGESVDLDVDETMPLLWVIRERIGLTGTKFGCGIALCGACTIHVDGVATRSCVTPAKEAVGRKITTIEGIAGDSGGLHPVQRAWISGQVPQCGYCQSGQIMAAVALLNRTNAPTDRDIDEAMSGVICRCGMYGRIRRAIRAVASVPAAEPGAGGDE